MQPIQNKTCIIKLNFVYLLLYQKNLDALTHTLRSYTKTTPAQSRDQNKCRNKYGRKFY